MKPNLTLIPLFATKTGIPFVFLEQQPNSSRIYIRHGSIITEFYCVPSSFSLGCPQLYACKKKEIKIYGRSGRTVASFLPAENALVIKRDGLINVFALDDFRILTFTTIHANQCKELVEVMDRLMITALLAG